MQKKCKHPQREGKDCRFNHVEKVWMSYLGIRPQVQPFEPIVFSLSSSRGTLLSSSPLSSSSSTSSTGPGFFRQLGTLNGMSTLLTLSSKMNKKYPDTFCQNNLNLMDASFTPRDLKGVKSRMTTALLDWVGLNFISIFFLHN